MRGAVWPLVLDVNNNLHTRDNSLFPRIFAPAFGKFIIGGRNANLEMVKAGLAGHYKKHQGGAAT